MSSIILQRIRLKKFRSFEDQYFSFDDLPEENLIEGNNIDDIGAGSNGAGKTTFVTVGVRWCIFGKSGIKILDHELIKDNEREAQVDLELMIDTRLIRITRIQTVKSQKLILEEFSDDDWVDISLRTKTMSQDYIIKLLGFDEGTTLADAADDFQRMVIIDNQTVNTLASKDITPMQRLEFVGRLLGIGKLRSAKKKTAEMLKPLTSEIAKIDGICEGAQRYLLNKKETDAFNKELDDILILVNNLEIKKLELEEEIISSKENEHVATQLNNLQREVKKIDHDLEINVSGKQNKIEDHLVEIKELDTIEERLSRLKDKEKDIEDNLKVLEKKILSNNESELNDRNSTLLAQISIKESGFRNKKQKADDFQKQIDNTVKCPSCETPLMVIKNSIQELNIEELKQEIKNLLDSYNQELDESEVLRTEYESLKILLDEIGTQKIEYQRLKNDSTSITLKKSDLESKKARADFHQEMVKSLQEDIKKLNETSDRDKSEVNDKIAKLKQKVSGLIRSSETIKLDLSGVNEKIKKNTTMKNAIDHKLKNSADSKKVIKEQKGLIEKIQNKEKLLRFWLEHFTLLTYNLVNAYVNEFQELSNNYLENLGMHHILFFKTTDETSTGKDKQVFNIKVKDRIAGHIRSMESCSEGERKRMAIAISFAAREIANRNRLSFEFAVLDEIFDALDVEGKEYVRNLLSKVSGKKFIITHSTELKEMFSSRIIVEKEHGVSNIVRDG